MNSFKVLIFACCVNLLAVSGFASENTAVRFTDFSGTCQAGAYDKLWGTALGWNRFDISWGRCEPVEGKWNDRYYQKVLEKIKANVDRGIKVLPMFGYAPGWAGTSEKYTFDFGNKRTEYVPLGNGKYHVIYYKKEKGKYIKTKERDLSHPRIPLNENRIAAWQKFIRRVVSDLKKPPYNIEYFQVWNEAHPKSGFWNGKIDVYMRQIHIPAAEVIHELGGKVVYGGFPCCGTVGGLVKILDRNKAWNTIDVIDIHYFHVQWMEYMRRNAAKRGYKDLGVWQTEFGFHRKYYTVPKNYPLFLYWGLSNNWDYIDRYKVFFFAYGSPNHPKAYGYGKCLMAGKSLTPHGQALKTLAELFGKDPIHKYKGVKTSPALHFRIRGSRMMAFKSGAKITIAFAFDSKMRKELSEGKKKQIIIKIPAVSRNSIVKVERIGPFGAREDILSAVKRAGKGVLFPVSAEKLKVVPGFLAEMLKDDNIPVWPAFYVQITVK